MEETSGRPAGSGLPALGLKSGSLVRGIGLVSVVAFSVHAISLSWSGQLPFSMIAGKWPGINLVLILGLALLTSLVLAYTFAVIGTMAPRSGADYYVGSRVLSGPLAFASSWTLVIFCGIVAGSVIASIPQSVLPLIFHTMAKITQNNQLIVLGDGLATPGNVVLFGTVIVVLVFMSLLITPKGIGNLLKLGLALGLTAWGIIYFQLASVPANAFPAAWDSMMGPDNYLDQIIQARALGMNFNYDPSATIIVGLVLGSFLFFGYYIATYFAGEVQKPDKNLLLGGLTSLLITGAIFIGAVLLVERLIPSEWIAAESYLYMNPDYSGNATPWITFYAAILRPNVVLAGIVAVAWVFTLFNLAQAYFFFVSRIIVAWTEDDLMPKVVKFIHPTQHSPTLPILFVAILAEVGVVDAALHATTFAQINFTFFIALVELVPVTAITLLPFLKRDWFNQASPLVRAKIGPIPVITIVGGLSAIYLVWLIISSFIFPVIGKLTPVTVIGFLGLFGSGLVWFYTRKAYLKQYRTELNLQPGQTTPAD